MEDVNYIERESADMGIWKKIVGGIKTIPAETKTQNRILREIQEEVKQKIKVK